MQPIKIKQQISTNRKELVDTLYLMMLQGINQLLPIFVMPYLMIKLGATGYGYVGFALSVIQYLIIIVDFGFNLSATKHIAMVKDDYVERSRVFWNVIAAKSVLLTVSAVILGTLLVAVPTFQFYSRAIIATFPMLLGSVFTFMWFFQGIGKIRLFSIINTISKVTLLPLIFIFVKSPNDYVLAAFLQAAVFLFTAIISNVYIIYKRLINWVPPIWTGIQSELHTSFPLFLSSASTSIYTQLIVVVLGFYCTTDIIGKYSSAERIMRAVCFLVYTPLNQVFFPKISSVSAKNRSEARRLFGQVRILVLMVMAIVGVAIWTSSIWLPSVLGEDYSGLDIYLKIFALTPFAIGVGGVYGQMGVGVAIWTSSIWLPSVLGEDYSGLDIYLKIFALTPFAIGVGGVYGQMGLIALGNEHTNHRFRDVYFIAAIASICMMFIFIPSLQAIGASIVVTATEVVVAILMIYNYKKYLKTC